MAQSKGSLGHGPDTLRPAQLTEALAALDAGDLLMFWTEGFVAPWQTDEWRAQMRRQLRPNAYLRLIENRWVSGEETFIDLDLWDACVDGDLRPAVADPDLTVWLGVDASTKRDSTAVVAVTFEDDAVRLVGHRVFNPTPDQPIDFETAVEGTVLDFASRFRVEGCHYGGLPIGMMLVGKHFDEGTLIQAAAAFERATDWRQR